MIYPRIARHLIHPLILWQTGERERLRWLAEFERSQFESAEQIRRRQDRLLEVLLDHVMDHNAFYRRRLEAAGVSRIGDSDPRQILAKLPPLTKSEIQESEAGMISGDQLVDRLIINQTGGSTGAPIRFRLDRSRFESRVAGMIRHDRWAGHDIGYRTAYVWGAPRDLPAAGWKTRLRNRLLGGQLWLDTSAITESGMQQFNRQLKSFRPRTIIGYANAMVMLANYARHTGMSVWQPNAVITSAELLTEAGRQAIEDVFGCPVFNRYGCREFSIVASECEQHDGLHLMAEGLLVEVESPDGADESGSLLVTDLLNRAMPLIRYRIGDRAANAEGACACGRGLPRLRAIEGRTTDFLLGTSGQLVSGVVLATYLVAQRPSLGQVQIVQDRAGQVLFRIRPGSGFDREADVHYLNEMARQHLGEQAEVDVDEVEEIPVPASGKMQFSISRALPDFADVNR